MRRELLFQRNFTNSILFTLIHRKRIKPQGTGIAYSIARLPSTLGGTGHSKTTSTSAGSPHSKTSLRNSMARQSTQPQIFPGFKAAKGILANYE